MSLDHLLGFGGWDRCYGCETVGIGEERVEVKVNVALKKSGRRAGAIIEGD